jgi:hypothetical protein
MKWLFDFISYIRPILETLYFIASICLVISLFIGIRQIKLFKEDMSIKNKRAAIEKSIEYLNWFATEYIPKTYEFHTKLSKKEITNYKGIINQNFIFDENCKEDDPQIKSIIDAYIECGGIDLLNQLEFFSAALLSGIADEELAFNPLADLYCGYISEFYVLMCYLRRGEKSNLYSNTIELYNMWNKRLIKIKLEKEKNRIDSDISNIGETQRIRSLGT